MRKLFPFIDWLEGYRKADFKGDLSAGFTVAVMLIPQGMAYALLAGLPPIIGLYASVVPLFIYAIFGTSRQLAVGPVAVVSLLVASGVGQLAQPGSEQYLLLAITLAGMVGGVQLLMGITRMGFLVNFLSHPVISGFTSAAALIIGLSQLKHLLGVNIPRSEQIFVVIWGAIENLSQVNLPTFLIGSGSMIILYLIKRWRPLFPGALLVVILSTLTVWGFDLHSGGVTIVGDVPAGLSPLKIPRIDMSAISGLLPMALTISFVGFMESIAVAKSFASKNRYQVDANQELIGLGLANIGAFFFSGYPVTGGFSRTAVNAQAGARTPLASMMSAGAVAVTLLTLTPLFHYLPKAVLAAIIMMAVFGLVDVREIKHLYRVKRSDLLLLLLAFMATLSWGVEKGILISVVASLMLVIKRTTRPHCAILGRLPGTTIYRNTERYPEARTVEGLAILRVDAELYFANVAFLKERLQELELHSKPPLRAIIVDASSINSLDSSADSALRDIAEDLRAKGIDLYFSNLKGPVRDVMQRSGFYQFLGENHFFFHNHDAVKYFSGQNSEIHHEGPGASVQTAAE